MKNKALIAAALALVFAAGVSARTVLFPEPLSQRIASYDMEVELDTDERLISGHETLTWLNTSDDRVRELWFHLYQNAFRNNRSSFIKEAGEDAAKKLKKRDGWGYCEVERISMANGTDLTDSMEYVHPDDDNEDDKTVIQVTLSEPVLPGDTIKLDVRFRTRLPEPPVARSGAKKEYFFAAQWFPKIGVYEEGEWNCHQYHHASEFYADFGVYNVSITVPKDNVVGATGVEVEVKDNEDGTATHVYHAEDVHDFVWTTSPRFMEFTGKEDDVDIRVLMQPWHRGQGERHLEAARLAVRYFQDWYGDYPFPNLTVVDPRRGARATGGMEYPTLITAGTFLGIPKGVRTVEMVIIHEFGHNFWYHMVASNEFEEAWLDEGINTYSEIRIVEDIYGKGSLLDLPGLKVEDRTMRRFSYSMAPDYDPVVKNAWDYYSRTTYGAMVYSKAALMLVTLENHLGGEVMQQIMRTYFEEYRFRHPHTRDFIEVAERVSGRDLDWFFSQALYSNAVLDYCVSCIESKEKPDGKGYDYTLSIDGEERGEKSVDGNKEVKLYQSKVKVRRLGGFRFPMEIEMTFEDGETVRESWDGKAPWREFEYVREEKLVKAEVDPDEKVALDVNFKNNQKTLKEQKLEDMKKGGTLSMIKFMLDPH